jgi:hypothetical protein
MPARPDHPSGEQGPAPGCSTGEAERGRLPPGGESAARRSAARRGGAVTAAAEASVANAAFGLRKAAADAARALGLFVNAGEPAPPCCGQAPEGN